VIIRRYKITFFASDANPISQLLRKPIHDETVILVKTVNAVDRKSVDKMAKGYVYEWLYETDNEFSDKLNHDNCEITWKIQCIRQARGE